MPSVPPEGWLSAMRTRAATLAATALVLTLGAAGTGAAAAPAKKPATPTCFGKHATKVLKANGKTLTGTKKNDVLVATGKNDTVLGLGGNDLICVTKPGKKVDAGTGNDKVSFVSGTVLGGAGNDTVTQKTGSTGTASIDGGAGNDTITLARGRATGDAGNDVITQNGRGLVHLDGGPGSDRLVVSAGVAPGSTADGGADPDQLVVPPAVLTAVSIPVTSGDTLNGVNLGIDQPASGGPAFTLVVDNRLSGGAPTPVSVLDPSYQLEPGSGSSVGFAGLAVAPGRDVASWSVHVNDGSPDDSGKGRPPQYLSHAFLAAGTYVVTGSVTDDHGATTVHSTTVVATTDLADIDPTITAGAPSGTSVTFTLTAPASPTKAPITSWVVDFGDQTEQSGTGSPDGHTVSHTYPQLGHYEATLQTLDTNGNHRSDEANVALGAVRTLSGRLMSNARIGLAARLIYPGESIRFDSWSQGYDSYTLDPGDGQAVIPGALSYFRYSTPGEYGLRWIGHRAAQPDEVLTIPVHVVAPPSSVHVQVPSFAAEGPVQVGFAGSVIGPGAKWTYTDPATGAAVNGTGPLPASLTEVLPARAGQYAMSLFPPYSVNVSIARSAVPLTDTTTLEYSVYTSAVINVVPLGTRAEPLVVDYYSGERRVGLESSTFIEQADTPIGVHAVTTTYAFDGTAITQAGTATTDPVTRVLGIGDHLIVATVLDSSGHVSRSTTIASIAGPTSLSDPADTTAVHGVAKAFGGWTEVVGANATARTWSIDWADSSPVTRGYGPIPATVNHTYATAGTYHPVVVVGDDHDQVEEQQFAVTVS